MYHFFKLRSRGKLFLISLLLGVLLTFAFAPFHLFPLGILVPACLLYLWRSLTPAEALKSGWLFGIGFFGSSVYWVYISIHTFGKASVFLSFLITVLFIAILALFPACQGWITKRLFKENHILWGFPLIWVLFEIIRTFLLTGFPWLLLGYSQMDSSLSNVAVIVGVYGVSGITLIFSSIVASFFLIKNKPLSKLALSFIALIVWLGSWGMGYLSFGVQSTGKLLQVSLIQGNIQQSLKWNPDKLKEILNVYRKLTNEHWSSDVIIWPEAAVPLLKDEASDFLNELDKTAKQNKTAIILGIPLEYQTNFYNAVIVIGKGEGTYLKRHLVPFGEYMPFRWLLSFILNYIQIPMADMSPGDDEQGLLVVKGVPFSASICYEIIYPRLIAKQLPKAEVLVTVTDDSWFDPSIAQDQQIQMTQMRALETGRYLLAATNDGVTAVIDPKGRIVKSLKSSQAGVLTERIPAMRGATPWVKFLHLFFP